MKYQILIHYKLENGEKTIHECCNLKTALNLFSDECLTCPNKSQILLQYKNRIILKFDQDTINYLNY